MAGIEEFFKRPHKYGARKVKDDGYTFDSQAEHRRYRELKLLERAGAIHDLRVHPTYVLRGAGNVKVCRYIADFTYVEPGRGVVTEDVKGVRTQVYLLKRKLFEAQFRRPVVELPA